MGEVVVIGRSAEDIVRDDATAIRRRMVLDTRRDSEIAVKLIGAAAPRSSGRLARSVHARPVRLGGGSTLGFNVIAGAENDGFPYLDVSRFGHRVLFILPKRSLRLKVFVDGRSRRPIFRHVVRGAHPARDWVEQGVDRAERAILNERRHI